MHLEPPAGQQLDHDAQVGFMLVFITRLPEHYCMGLAAQNVDGSQNTAFPDDFWVHLQKLTLRPQKTTSARKGRRYLRLAALQLRQTRHDLIRCYSQSEDDQRKSRALTCKEISVPDNAASSLVGPTGLTARCLRCSRLSIREPAVAPPVSPKSQPLRTVAKILIERSILRHQTVVSSPCVRDRNRNRSFSASRMPQIR